MIVVGVVHLLPLPGSYGWKGDLGKVIERAVRDAKALERGGADAIIVENYMDYPFNVRVDYVRVAAATRVVEEVVGSVNVSVGVSLLRNSAPEAVAVALASGARFVRSNQWCWTSDSPEGLLEPVAVESLEVMRRWGREVGVIADVRVKHASPVSGRSLCDEARDLGGRCRAGALAVSGEATGAEARVEDLLEAKRCSALPVLVASGVSPENILKYERADGVIVGTYFKEGGVTENPVDPARVRKLVELAKRLRSDREERLARVLGIA